MMKINNYAYALTTMLLLQASGAFAAIVIQEPKKGAVIDKNHLTVSVNGTCTKGQIIKINAVDSAGKATDFEWRECQSWGYIADLNISALKDGNITVGVIQNVTRKPQKASTTIVKNATVVVAPSPSPSPSPTVVPSPSPTVVPSPSPTVVPSPSPSPVASGPVFGVGGHDGRKYWPMADAEKRFKLLDANNLRTYRFDIDPRNFEVMDQMVALGKKYNITLRPLIFTISQTDMTLLTNVGYAMGKRYANDIKIFEIENEQDYDRAGAQGRINAMVALYKGFKKASDELNANLKFTINIMACNDDDKTGRCGGDPKGDMWFLDMAKASGFNFDYISFHYYAWIGDQGYWFDKFLGQARGAAVKYNTKIFFNETNCGDIYRGNTDGGYKGDGACYDSIVQLFKEVKTKYSDIIAEVNMYELIDDPESQGVEAHFGLMYNLDSPKPNFQALVNAANGK
jgi:hypothetical protein